jgi:hypothetical protein
MMPLRENVLLKLGSLMLVLGAVFSAFCQNSEPSQTSVNAGTADSQIEAALKSVSAQHIQADVEKLVSFGTRLTLSAQDPASIAAGQGIGAAREWIKAQFERYSKDCGGCLEVKTDAFTEPAGERIPKPTEITNIYAVLKGTDSESAKRIVLVTGHYDSRNSDTFDTAGAAPGANDDASGTAVSLECARVLSKLKFPATIIFLTVAGEEQGLNGSKHFAEMAKQQGWNLEAVLNNDIVGGDRNPQQDPSVVRVFSEGLPVASTDQEIRRIRMLGGENDSPSRELARYLAEVSRTYTTEVQPLLIFRLDRYLRGGDHYSFNQQGFAAVRFTEYREDFNHQHQNIRTEQRNFTSGPMNHPIVKPLVVQFGDLPKFVNFDFVAHVAQLNAATLASLAAAPAPPTNVRLATTNLENSSTITWDPSPRASGYEVLWRETSSPDWNHIETASAGNRATLDISKDNVIFAVRAADPQGHRSLPVVPTPER